MFGGEPECRHQFEGDIIHEHREEPTHAKSRTTDRFYGGDETRCFDGNHQKHVSNQFCSLCGAWRGQFGLEPDPESYIQHTLEFLRAMRRVLRKDGTVWWNLGDSYAGSGVHADYHANPGISQAGKRRGAIATPVTAGLKAKDMVMIPFRVALAAQADGWWVRSVIIWNKPNPMPESVRDRPTTSHEYVLLLTKSARYFYDADAIREPQSPGTFERYGKNPIIPPKKKWLGVAGESHVAMQEHIEARDGGMTAILPGGRNKRTVWTIATQPYPEAHFATFPEALVEPMILTTPTKCCAECGAGWERVTEVVERHIGGGTPRCSEEDLSLFLQTHGTTHHSRAGLTQSTNRTLGFRPTCSCDAESKPAVILDPFAGRGTVARVARKHNRDFVMIEMNPDYILMMKRYLSMADEEVETEGETWVQPRMELAT